MSEKTDKHYADEMKRRLDGVITIMNEAKKDGVILGFKIDERGNGFEISSLTVQRSYI